MGCHTWFYDKIEAPKQEVISKYCIKKYKSAIEEYKLCSDKEFDSYMRYRKFNGHWSRADYIDLLTRVICWIEKGWITTALNGIYCCGTNRTYRKESNTFYKDCMLHGIIRVWGYPEDVFIDYDSLYKWLQTYEKKEPISDEQYARLKQFFDDRPEGAMIDFG